MKMTSLIAAGTLALAAALYAAEPAKFTSQPGSKVKIDGTSTIHDWTVEGGIIAGAMELDSAFSADPTKAKPGKVDAKVEATIPVRTIKSGKNNMDAVMHGALKQAQHPTIRYRLTELNLKETPKSANGPWLFDSKGELTVAGVTNKVAFPVTMTRTDKTIKTTGSTAVKMTSFGIQPPSPTGTFGIIKTGDDVKLTFDWIAGEAK
jgi:polyisoprenoid-binding protein YceI